MTEAAGRRGDAGGRGGEPCLVNLIYVGDSIIFGASVDPARRWTSLVSERLVRRYLDTAVHVYSVNRGVSGATTRSGLEEFPKSVQQESPNIVVVQFGLNDCNCWATDRGLPRVSEAAFRANLTEMVARARHFGASEVVLVNNHRTLRYKKMLNGERYEDSNARYSKMIGEVAETVKTTLGDIRSAFAAFSLDELSSLLLPYPDHIHVSEEGHRVYAATMQPILERAVEQVIKAKTQRA